MDIKEYAIEHEQQIIEDFALAHETEWNDYEDRYSGEEYRYDDIRREFCEQHPDYQRFVELHYADYRAGGQ